MLPKASHTETRHSLFQEEEAQFKKFILLIISQARQRLPRKPEENRPSTMSFKPREAELVPPALRACLGTLSGGGGNSAQSYWSRDQRRVFEPEQRPHLQVHGNRKARAATSAIPPCHPGSVPTKVRLGGQTLSRLPEASTHTSASAILGIRGFKFQGPFQLRHRALGCTHPTPIPWKTLHPLPNRNSYQVGTIPRTPAGPLPPPGL